MERLAGVVVLGLLGVMGGLACGGPGAVAQAVRPEAPTASVALEERPCTGVEERGAPLVVDWKAEERSDLEIAMRDSLAILDYTCGSIRVLPDCHADGRYGFNAVTIKQQAIQLKDVDELHANLPKSGALLGAKFGADLSRGASLEIGMAIIGRHRTTRLHVQRNDLKGECKGATHFVRGATLGAFAMQMNSEAGVHTVAQIFSGGAEASSGSLRNERTSDGVLTDCDASMPSDLAPPKRCGALLRIELVGIDGATEPAAPTRAPDQADAECRAGLVMSNGKCTTPAPGVVATCRLHDIGGCTKQCDAGSARSCEMLAWNYLEGHKVATDVRRAADLYTRACSLGAKKACIAVGSAYAKGGPGFPVNTAKAIEIYRTACGKDEGGCNSLAGYYENGNGVPKDETKGKELRRQGMKIYERECDAGDLESCNRLAVELYYGWSGIEDAPRAVKLYQRACDGGDPDGCRNLGDLYQRGKAGLKTDATQAVKLYKLACDAEDADGCGYYGWMLGKGLGVARDIDRGIELVRKACKWRDVPVHCDRVKELERAR